jgi:molybdopterin synthase sulfur carrier subunit
VSVEVRLYGDLAEETAHDRIIVEAETGTTVGRILAQVKSAERLIFSGVGELSPEINVLLNGRSVRGLEGLDTPVGDGDRVHVLRAFGGG